MHQIKIFTSSSPSEVEEQANDWLKLHSERYDIRLTQVAPTDVVQISSDIGIQRFTLVIVYELHERGT